MNRTAFVLAFLPSLALAQAKKPIPSSEWGRFESLGSAEISPDGKWVTYDFRRGIGAGELRYRAVGSSNETSVFNATGGTFTANSRWLVYTLLPDTGGAGRGGRAGRAGGGGGAGRAGQGGGGGAGAPRNKVAIVDLRSGSTTVLEDIQSFALNKTGSHIALRRYAPQGRQSRGADLVVRALETAADVTLGNVAEYSFNDDGSTLAMIVDVDGKTGNGVQLLNLATSAIGSVDQSDNAYTGLTWRARSQDLAVYRSRTDTAFADTSYSVVAWRGAGHTKATYDFAADASFPSGMRVANYRGLSWSDDGGTLFFGIAQRDMKPMARDRNAPMPARVEVWHWKDLREYHMQDRQSAQDRTRTTLVAWHAGQNRVIKLSDDPYEQLQFSQDRKALIASDETPYFTEQISGRQYRDVYSVDLASGKRDKILTKTAFGAQMSPDGKVALYSQGGQWMALDVASGKRTNLTANVKTGWLDMEDDHPVAERRPYGLGGWTTGNKSVLLYDRFDVWNVNTDGTGGTRVSRGREDSTVYRVVRAGTSGGRGGRGGGGRGGFGGGGADVDPEERWIDASKPVTLSATGEFNKKSGWSRVTLGQAPTRTLWVDKQVGALEKAKDADAYIFEQQTAAESPNLFLASSSNFATPTKISNTNAFLSDYAWGKQVLMPYTNSVSKEKLQMMLTYPADYVPGKKYPMVVYYYEKLSQGFHQFIVPTDRATYNTTVFSQNGYFVLRPDIRFRKRDPGVSGLECVTSAVKEAISKVADIDPTKVGNMGHSWGGYQSAFYAVNGNGLFAATIAGAPLTDLISMYGYSSFNTGAAETGHFETGQERMDVPLWEDPQAYIRNSTVFQVDKLKTPLLLEEGDADGNVNPWQSHELYNFGRRLGKQVVYLLYNDENHGVARPESQQDYAKRQLEWFGTFLKGEKAPDWISRGETYLERQKLLKDAAAPAGRGGIVPIP